MEKLKVEQLRNCLEGFVPAIIATCDPDGAPNVSLLSQVHYVDPQRVALSYQFFNKTRQNILLTKRACVQVVDPVTMEQFRLQLEYEETRTSGPLFETMKAKLAGIASHSGMEGVFRLLGSDVYKVIAIDPVPGPPPKAAPAPAFNLPSAVRRICESQSACAELAELFDVTLSKLHEFLDIDHAMILMSEGDAQRLYTVASRGYFHSGIGSEVAFGEGVIGVSARESVPIRIAHVTSDYKYSTAIREAALSAGVDCVQSSEIPFPGLVDPHSQIALPIICEGRMFGVLFAESEQAMRFWQDDEDALATIAAHLGAMMRLIHHNESQVQAASRTIAPSQWSRDIAVRHYPHDNSVFLDNEYLIKGVAGAIFWRLIQEFDSSGRLEFTNRELRMDPALRLPEHSENLEARLLLLQRRLAERATGVTIEKAGRGRFRLNLTRRPVLTVADAGAARTSAV